MKPHQISSLIEQESLSASRAPLLLLRFPPDGHLRMREVVTRSRARPTCEYPSWKMGRMMQCESIHERDVYCLLDADASVLRFHEQPVEITYRCDEKVQRHYPDTLVETRTSKEFWEIKPAMAAVQAEHLQRAQWLTQVLPQYGYRYRLVVTEEFVSPIRLHAARMLLTYGRGDIPLLEREQLRRLLALRPRFTWGEVRAGLFGQRGSHYICRLLLEGRLEWDRMQPFAADTPISVVEPEQTTGAAGGDDDARR